MYSAGSFTALYVRDLPSAPNMAVFQSGDIVRLRQFSRAAGSVTIGNCWGVVTDYTDGNGVNFADGLQFWKFTRSAAPNDGAMAAGTVIQADALVLDYGTTGNGFYEVNAVDGSYGLNSPYAQIVSWASHPASGQAVRARLGNLRGIFGAANEYGLYAGAGAATSDAYLRISNTEVGLYNLPLRMYTGGTERVHIAAHNDVWIGPSSADKRLSWDGTTLTISGAINVVGGDAATQSYASTAAATAQTNAQSYAVAQDAGRATTDLSNSVISTLITGNSIRVGSGTKDSTLNGWNIDSTEIVGQASGVDQVALSAADGIALLATGTEPSGPDWKTINWNSGFPASSGNLIADIRAFYDSWNQIAVTAHNLSTTRGARTRFGNKINGTFSAGIRVTSNYVSGAWGNVVDVYGHLISYDPVSLYGQLSVSGNSYFVNIASIGVVGDSWSSLTPAAGFSNLGSGYATLGVKRFGSLISLKGVLVTTTSIGVGTNLCSALSSEYRPSSTRIFTVAASIGNVRVDVRADGTMATQAALPSGAWLSLELMYFTGG